MMRGQWIAIQHIDPNFYYESPESFVRFISCEGWKALYESEKKDITEAFRVRALSFEAALFAIDRATSDFDRALSRGKRYSVLIDQEESENVS